MHLKCTSAFAFCCAAAAGCSESTTAKFLFSDVLKLGSHHDSDVELSFAESRLSILAAMKF